MKGLHKKTRRTRKPAPTKKRPRGKRFRTPKLQGEFAEMLFWIKCATLGFILSKPWGDSCRYDFIADYHGRLSRVQVKSVRHFDGHSYAAQIASRSSRSAHQRCYTASEVDFVAVCVLPKNTWYIIPILVLRNRSAIRVAPEVPRQHPNYSKYERFREAWHLMR